MKERQKVTQEEIDRAIDEFLKEERLVVSLPELIRAIYGKNSISSDERYHFEETLKLYAQRTMRIVPSPGSRNVYNILDMHGSEAWTEKMVSQMVSTVFAEFLEPENIKSFPAGGYLYKVSLNKSEHSVRLHFDFPDVAEQLHQDRIAFLKEKTGWKFSFNEFPRSSKFEELLAFIVPVDSLKNPNPSYRQDRKSVTIDVTDEFASSEEGRKLKEQFKKITGLSLLFSRESAVAEKTERRGAEGRMEINKAFNYILEQFAGSPHQICRKSRKFGKNGEYIEVGFITPEVANLYRDRFCEISKAIGWEIKLSTAYYTHAIGKVVREVCAELALKLKGEPSFINSPPKVKVRLKGGDPDSIEKLRTKLFDYLRIPIDIDA